MVNADGGRDSLTLRSLELLVIPAFGVALDHHGLGLDYCDYLYTFWGAAFIGFKQSECVMAPGIPPGNSAGNCAPYTSIPDIHPCGHATRLRSHSLMAGGLEPPRASVAFACITLPFTIIEEPSGL